MLLLLLSNRRIREKNAPHSHTRCVFVTHCLQVIFAGQKPTWLPHNSIAITSETVGQFGVVFVAQWPLLGRFLTVSIHLPVSLADGLLEERVQRSHLRLGQLGPLHGQHPVQVRGGALGEQPRELRHEALAAAL